MSAQQPRPEGYEFGCPEGEWIGSLDDKRWGQSKNLMLYFTKVGTGARYWFSVFWADDYRARDKTVAFRNEEPGERYKLTTRMNDKGKPVFLAAEKL